MGNPNKQQQMPFPKIENIQEIGEELLEYIIGGTLSEGILTPVIRAVLRRTESAPGRLQGNKYPGDITLPNSPASTVSSGFSDFSHSSMREAHVGIGSVQIHHTPLPGTP
jgi:hypothetical protein